MTDLAEYVKELIQPLVGFLAGVYAHKARCARKSKRLERHKVVDRAPDAEGPVY